MDFLAEEIYHVYNRGNAKQKIFFKQENYKYFLKKIKKFVVPYCDLLGWCLMPNHFHFLIAADQRTISPARNFGWNMLSEGIRLALSGYTQGINIQENRTGSLFQQNTKAKIVSGIGDSYEHTCLHYIHQNPVVAGLVKKMEDWEFSTFRDYSGMRKSDLVNVELASKRLGLNMESFYEDSYRKLKGEDLERIF